MAKNTKKHRGRIQAQGGGIEESESWAQDEPLKISKARLLFQRLIAKLSRKDYEKRRKAFEKAKEFTENISRNGSMFAVKKESFRVKGENGSEGERVDIEILGGEAFVKDN